MLDLDAIPQDQTTDLPMGVSEANFRTEAEMEAFLKGLTYADDVDVLYGTPFVRDGLQTVRVLVGDWEGCDDD